MSDTTVAASSEEELGDDEPGASGGPGRLARLLALLKASAPSWKATLAALLLLSGCVAALVMTQASTLLGSAQTDGSASYRAGALTRMPWPPLDDEKIVGALQAWASAGDTLGRIGLVGSWARVHQLLDLFVLIPSVTFVVWWVLQHSVPEQLRGRLPLVMALTYGVLDVVETLLTLRLTYGLRPDGDPANLFESGAATQAVALFAFLKWVALFACLVVVVLSQLRPNSPIRQMSLPGLLWRVRVQTFAVALFAVLIAAPLSGPLDQVPDLLRSSNDNGVVSHEFLIPALMLALFCFGIWTSGQLIVDAPTTTDGVPPLEGDDSIRWSWRAGVTAVALWVLAGVAKLIDPLHASAGVFAAAIVATLWFFLDALAQRIARSVGQATTASLPRYADAGLEDTDRTRLRRVVDVLTVMPLGAAALGAVRAYAGPSLLAGAGAENPGSKAWLAFGAMSTLATFGAWVCLRALRTGLEERLETFTVVATWSLAVASVVLAVYCAVNPADAAEALQGHGVLSLFLLLLVSVGGLVQRQAQEGTTGRLPSALGMARTPWFAVLVVVALLAGALDSAIGYHSPRATDGAPSPAAPVETALAQWLRVNKDCRVGSDPPGPDGRVRIPLVLVAAPGGGARAAYWTSLAMHGIASADGCDGSSIFAASGVSGGSVGLALWSVSAPDDVHRDARLLTDAQPLSADVAGLLFRDLPRAFTGLHPLGIDRAAVEEDAWIDRVPALDQDFADVGGPTTAEEQAEGRPPWQSHLILNGSDLSTGCKVLLTNLSTTPDPSRPVTDCRAVPDYAPEDAEFALPGGAIDARQFMSRADCEGTDTRSVSTATAALLSARFPFVSPTGQMARCGSMDGSPSDYLYVGDGGYLENSGLHSLLALWADSRGWVERINRSSEDVVVLPMAVLVDNHFHSPATQAPRPKLDELTAPMKANRLALVQQTALEQSTRAVFTGDVPGVAGRQPQQRWFVVAPTDRPQVAAPLGWSLSRSARASLRCQLNDALDPPKGACATFGRQVDQDVTALVRLLAPED